LKTGWGLGRCDHLVYSQFYDLEIACVKSSRVGCRTDMSILENNAMQSTASSAGYSTGGTIVSAISAYLLVNGVHITYGLLSAWVFFLAVLGVTMAIPMKRQMINIERLKFPSGIAAAETLKSLHGVGHTEGGGESKSAKLLFTWGGIGIAIAAVRDLFGWIPALYNTFGSRLATYTVQFDASMILVAAGALMGIKVCVSILIGGILNWGILAPMMIDKGVITHPLPHVRSYEDLKFPLTIPAGESLTFEIVKANQDYLIENGADTTVVTYPWSEATTYASMNALATALNNSRLPDGSPNPYFGRLKVVEPEDAYLKKRLEIRVDSSFKQAINVETSLALLDPRRSDEKSTVMTASRQLAFENDASDVQAAGGFRNIVSWSLWGGAACMVTSGLLAFIFEWRTALRAFSGLKNIFKSAKHTDNDPLERIEVPGSWFLGGMVFGTVGIVILALLYFNIPIWMSLLAVILSFFLALVACRACGETDTTPVGAMGKITQLIYGAIAPRQMNTNLMSACITAGVADSASDLLTDLKSGYVLGANARKQFLAQFAGIFVGTAVTVPAFFLVVPDVSILGSTQFPAPAAQVWASVARLLSNGFESLHPTARTALIIGGIVGLLIPMLERMFPKWNKWIPSAMGLGLAFVLPFYNALSMFIGGVIALIYMRVNKKDGEQFTVASASGIIAGESLMGIFITLLGALGWL
jgi:uncharacterized oligopeptide transporter (OPT) family protein